MAKRAYLILGVLILAGLILVGCQPKELTSAKVYKQQNDWDNVIVQLEKAVQLYPENAEAHFLLGEAYGQKGRFAEMSEQFDASMKIAPTFEQDIKYYREKYWVDNFNNSVKTFNEGNMDKTIEILKTAAQIDPTRPETYRNMAVAYFQLDSLDESLVAYDKAIAIDSSDIETLSNKGLTLFQMKKYEESIDVFKKVIEMDPVNDKAVANIALAYDQLGETDKAIAAYEDALKTAPDNADLLFNYARLFTQKGEFEKAIGILEKVIAANPDDYESLLVVGDAYLRMGEEFKAKAGDMDVEGKPEKQVDAMRKRAKDTYAKSVVYLEKAVALKDDVASIWHNLGVAYINAGDVEKGTKAWEKAEALKKAEQ